MYEVIFTPAARRMLARLDPPMAQEVLDRVHWFAAHFDEVNQERLTGPYSDRFRLRVRAYRVLYDFDRRRRRMVVREIRHRSKAY